MLDYHIDLSRNMVVTRASGRLTIGDLTNHLVRLMRDPAFKPELNALVIANDVSAVPNSLGVGALTPLVRAWSKRRAGVKWAFVLPNRATLDFAESALGGLRLTALTWRCFLSEAHAASWLERVPATVEPPDRAFATATRAQPASCR